MTNTSNPTPRITEGENGTILVDGNPVPKNAAGKKLLEEAEAQDLENGFTPFYY